ncbi:MAG: ABC transporter substrate-binding protein [Rhodovibrionaceae bacterium]|nr:ABC transporter substrate-binding protein [Rhodovibrionaceae bacterium]
MDKFKQLERAFAEGRISRREFMIAASAIGAGVAASGLILPKGAHAATPKKGGRLRIGTAGGNTTDSLDPATYTDTYMLTVGFSTHNTLTNMSPKGVVEGDLAESWEPSPDAKSWTFKLRKGVEFSNGKELTAHDVIATMNHHRGEESKSAAKSIVDPIVEMKAEDKHTVTFVLKNGNADFPYLMLDYHLLILPADEDGNVNWQDYVGTGGYTLAEHEAGVRTLLKRNPNYFKEDAAWADEIEIIHIKDANSRQNALTTGEVDAINRVDLKTVHLLQRASDIRILEETGYLHYTAPMLTDVAPFDDNNVRMAIKHAVNREALVETILRGHGIVGNDTPISPSVPFYADLEQRTYDPDKAKWYLKQAGMSELKVDLSTSEAAFAGAVDASVLIKEQAAKANIDINLVREPEDGYWSNVWLKKPWCMCYWGGRPTCDWMFTTAYAEDSNWNDTHWEHERFNKLLIQARAELDTAKREEMYREMQELVRDEGGVVVFAFANYVMASGPRAGIPEEIASNWEFDGGRIGDRWWVEDS